MNLQLSENVKSEIQSPNMSNLFTLKGSISVDTEYLVTPEIFFRNHIFMALIEDTLDTQEVLEIL